MNSSRLLVSPNFKQSILIFCAFEIQLIFHHEFSWNSMAEAWKLKKLTYKAKATNSGEWEHKEF